ncbi:MAG: hypothetical protein U0174_25895 [Polyangiaceae bacterium]
MSKSSVAVVSTLLFALIGASSLGACGSDDGETEDNLRPGERKLVGPAVPYKADPALRARTEELALSQKKRREVAWKAIAKILQPVKVQEKMIKLDADGGLLDAGQPRDGGTLATVTLPVFRTWYGRDDFERIFGKAYGDLTKTQRKNRTPFTEKQIDKVFDWNATSAGSWSNDDYIRRIKAVVDQQGVQGLGGNGRVSYSPGYFRHFLRNYGTAYKCLKILPTLADDAPPPSATNFSQCYKTEFPIDAAVIKASWSRNAFDNKVTVHDTSAAALKSRMDGSADNGGWGNGDHEVTPTANQIYTMKTSDGSSYWLNGIHLITKELRDWLWITIWFSDTPDSDFGADRPAEIKALGAPWTNYKMAVATAYDERDPDPKGGFTGSLGDALKAVYPDAVGGPSWASNPYIEKGDKNAQTNCIGCHQHAGLPGLGPEGILADEAKFPKAGRTKVRKSFPTDYTWSFDFPPEAFVRTIETQIVHYDGVDR